MGGQRHTRRSVVSGFRARPKRVQDVERVVAAAVVVVGGDDAVDHAVVERGRVARGLRLRDQTKAGSERGASLLRRPRERGRPPPGRRAIVGSAENVIAASAGAPWGPATTPPSGRCSPAAPGTWAPCARRRGAGPAPAAGEYWAAGGDVRAESHAVPGRRGCGVPEGGRRGGRGGGAGRTREVSPWALATCASMSLRIFRM